METNKLKYSEDESLEACGVYLRQILDGLESSNLSMTRGEDHIRLRPCGPVRFKLKVKQKGNEEQVSVELSWSRADDVPLVASGSSSDELEASESESADSPRNQSEGRIESATGSASERPVEDVAIAERWMTRERLYESATEHQIAGRSQMSKEELVVALFAAGVDPVDHLSRKELYAIAQEAEVDGRSTMNRDELIDALRSKVQADVETAA